LTDQPGIRPVFGLHRRPHHAPAQRTPDIIERALKDGHEIASHGLRWINYHGMSEAQEREHLEQAMEILTGICGNRPLGWYTGRTSENTRRLVAEYGGFLYDADDYSDDLPFWSKVEPGQLIVPYTLDTNDMRFATPQGFHNADQFFVYLKDAFDTLREEGDNHPKMMSVGMHARVLGRPARFRALRQFVEYITCSIPDDHIDPRRGALFVARSILTEMRDEDRTC
jgi:allantoinase